MEKKYLLLTLLIGLLSTTTYTFASTGVIDITAANKAKVCYDPTCTTPTPGVINFELQQVPSIQIDSATGISGFVWGDNLGWINFAPSGSGVTFADPSTGLLTGYAWSQVSGWINFAPSGQSVKINPDTGEFEGWAWVGGLYGGWIKFDCQDQDACVKTTWRKTKVIGGGGGTTILPPPPPPGKDIFPPPPPPPPRDLDKDKEKDKEKDKDKDKPSDEDKEIIPPPRDGGPRGGGLPPSPGSFVRINSVSELLQNMTFLGRVIEDFFQTVKNGIVVVSTAIAVLSLAPLIDIPRLLGHFWNMILTALGLRKKRKPWGTVYDSQTKQPLDPAYVTLTNMEGKEVASSITDIDGRYGFVVQPGTYRLFVKKTNYDFPSKRLQGRFEDELYTKLYFGEPVTITEDGEIINKNIPLDQKAFDWNEFAKKQQHRLTYFKKRDIILGKISQLLFGLGFSFALVTLFIEPTVLHLAIALLYILIFFARRHDPKLKAKGFVSKIDGAPLPFAIIRLISKTTGQEIAHKVADTIGRYYAIVPNGTYTVVIDEKMPDGSYTKHTLSETYSISEGYLSKKIVLP